MMLEEKLNLILFESDKEYQKMKDWFDKRTKKHIERVQKYCKKIEEYDKDKFSGLIEQGKLHDQSKYEDPEIDPYIYITWDYKCKEDGVDFEPPDGMDEKMNKASEHHVKSNRHHPEYHSDRKVNLINKKDRDKAPEEEVDATEMPDLDIAELCADWMAMSEEMGDHPKDWADKNLKGKNIRWKFSKGQKDLIYELISEIWD